MPEFAVMQQGIVEHNLFAYCGNEPIGNIDPYGNDAIYVVDYNSSTGLKVLGHAVLCFQDSSGNWYYTEFYNNSEVVFSKLNKKACERLFGNLSTKLIATSGTKFIYLEGDYSPCYEKAKAYYEKGFGEYKFFKNNCLHYVQKVMSCANVSKGLKRIYRTPLVAPNLFGNTIIAYYSLNSLSKKVKEFFSKIKKIYKQASKVYNAYKKAKKIKF